MKEKKKLKKLAAKSVKLSIEKGRVKRVNADEVIKILKTLPRAQAIYAISKFLKGLRRRGGETTVTIESAVPLSKKEISKVIKELSQEFVLTDVQNKVNPDILGGIKVKIGDTVLDYSIAGRISQIGKVIES